MSAKQELKADILPCPFCGSLHIARLGHVWPTVKCMDCGTYQETIAAWNHRPLEDALQRENEALRAENARLKSELLARNEYGYSQETVNALTAERDALRDGFDPNVTLPPVMTLVLVYWFGTDFGLSMYDGDGRWRYSGARFETIPPARWWPTPSVAKEGGE